MKSHEVDRYIYSRHLKEAGYNQNHHHFVLSCDVTRVITFPGSLNGETGLICKYLGGPGDFSRMPVSKIIWDSDATKYLYDLTLVRASELHAHPEPWIPAG